MKRVALVLLLLAGGCSAPEPAIDSVAEAQHQLRRMYREARAEANPTRETLVRLLRIDPAEEGARLLRLTRAARRGAPPASVFSAR